MSNLIFQLRENVERLKHLAQIPQQEFTADPDKAGSAKYRFIIAIELCMDMSNHVIARNGYRIPEDYADTFKVMAEAGALEKKFAQEIGELAILRDRLVHNYWEIDDKEFHETLRKRLDDYRTFIESLLSFLNWEA